MVLRERSSQVKYLLTTPCKMSLLRGARNAVRGIAIESYLVDALPPTSPPEFAPLRLAFDRVPRELELSDGWTAVVYAPTGIARVWLDEDPDEVVSASHHEFVRHDPAAQPPARAAARLVIRRGIAVVGALPLIVGLVGTFHTPTALLELVPLSWEIRAGAMRGGLPGSARIELAWRSRLATGGVITSGGASGGQASGSSSAGGSPPSNRRVLVSTEGGTGRNLEFLDVATGRIMARDVFVAEIRAGTFPGYEVRMIRGVATPVSRRTPAADDNLG
jgi:hypothetical protein